MTRFKTLVVLVISAGLLVALPALSHAAGSDEEKTEQKADEKTQEATENYNNGLKHMQKANEIAAKGDSAFAYNYRATSDAKAQKEYEQAVGDFKAAVEIMPAMKEAWNNLGYTYRKLGNFEASLQAYDKAIELDKDFAQAREYRGETYLAMGEMEKARNELDYLKKIESPYADTLAASIRLYKLKEVSSMMKQK